MTTPCSHPHCSNPANTTIVGKAGRFDVCSGSGHVRMRGHIQWGYMKAHGYVMEDGQVVEQDEEAEDDGGVVEIAEPRPPRRASFAMPAKVTGKGKEEKRQPTRKGQMELW